MVSRRTLRLGLSLLAAGVLLLAFAGCANPLELFIPVSSHASQSSAIASGSAQADCTASKNTVCAITLTNNTTSAGNLTWSAQGSVPAHAAFSPTSGVLTPGQRQTITVTFAGRVCTPSVTILQSWSAPADGHASPFPMEMHATSSGC
ncbi:MAG: hypothetical protein ABI068_04540 [Ktedonobacterales bacterium]